MDGQLRFSARQFLVEKLAKDSQVVTQNHLEFTFFMLEVATITHTHIHIYKYIHIHIVHTHIYVCIYRCIYIHTNTCMHTDFIFY